MIPEVGGLVSAVGSMQPEPKPEQTAGVKGAALQIPPELRRSAPRDVELSAAGKAMVVFALVLLAGAATLGVFLARQVQSELRTRQRIANSAVYVGGEVIGLERTRGENPRTIVTYRYTVDGTSYSGRNRLQPRSARQLRIGSSVDVGYFPGDPGSGWLRQSESGGTPLWIPIVAPLGMVLAPLLIGIQVRRQKQLLEEGRPAIARVTDSKRVSGQHGGSYRVSVEFRDMSGATRTARFQQQRKQPVVGDDMVILYDPDERRRVAAYPLQFVRVSTPL